jgi:predicted nucleic acid-binding protein
MARRREGKSVRVLLDTNILIHREAGVVDRADIGVLFRWLDRIHAEKCIHPGSISEIERHDDPQVVRSFKAKLASYHVLKTLAPETPEIAAVGAADLTANDKFDTSLLLEVAAGRVNVLITEDREIHRKARGLNLTSKVFTIDSFLEKVTAENPELADYTVLSVKKAYFGGVNLRDPFFDSFRADYHGFDDWFNHKADETAYLCTGDDGRVVAFLYLKREGPEENYRDIEPPFIPAPRLKIGSFKVSSNGYKLGERFLKIVFDNALKYGVHEIYVTAFVRTDEQERLIRLLGDWGFVRHGTKTSTAGTEQVFVRKFTPAVDPRDPRRTYPYISRRTRKFIVPVYPKYHTELLPDSILNTESPADFVENRPNRNAISKVYISRSIERGLRPGDVIVFYRTKSGAAPAHYTSVATTIGIVQDVILNIKSKEEFIQICRTRSVFSDEELGQHWDQSPSNRPFVVNFLYVCSLPMRPNLAQLKAAGIISEAPRGFEQLSAEAFEKLLEVSNADTRIAVN